MRGVDDGVDEGGVDEWMRGGWMECGAGKRQREG